MNVSKVAKKGLGYTQTGTPYYASPEVWQDKPYGTKSDIWSLGCILYEAISLRPPFQAADMYELYQKVLQGISQINIIGSYKKIPTCYSLDLGAVVKQLLKVSPKQRPSCGNLSAITSNRRYP